MDLLYLIRSGLGIPDYWHPHLEIQTDFLSESAGCYPISMCAKADYPGELNDEGVPIIFVNRKPCISPATVALYGLGNHDAFLITREELHYQRMLAALRWLKNHGTPLGDGIGWANQEDLPSYGLKAPWFSSMVQGFALSLLVRGSKLESDDSWSELARQAWRSYRVPIEAGGFARGIQGGIVYEEYPGPSLDCVFNGMCHSLIGLWEAWKFKLAADAEVDFDKGIRTLRALLPRFVHGNWSLYSLNQCLGKPLLASPYYQRANGLLAKVLGMMVGDSEFSVYGERWLKASESLAQRITMSLHIGLDRYIAAPALLHSDKARSG